MDGNEREAEIDAAAREAALRDILEIVSRSRDDEAPVFQAIHESASRLCDAPFSGLFLVDESGLNLDLVSHLGGDPEYIKASNVKWPLSQSAAVTDAVVKREVVHMRDLLETDAYRAGDEAMVRAVEMEGMRTFLAVPLLTADGAIGTLGLYRREQRPFTEDQIALLETFAAQAVIAIENVRQFRELQERLEREAASAEILEVISRSRDDEAPVFEKIVQKAAALCASNTAALVLGRADDAFMTLGAEVGATPEAVRRFEDGEMPLDSDDSFTARAILTGEILHFPDMMDTSEYRSGAATVRAMVDVAGIRSTLFVPLIAKGGAIGCIVLFKLGVDPYTPDQVALVESFAAQAVIAIENVRQFREVQERLERERATAEILSAISQSRDDEQPVFDLIIEQAMRLCNAASARLHLRTEDGEHGRAAAMCGVRFTGFEIGYEYSLSEPGPVSTAFRERRVVSVDDLAAEVLYREGDPIRVKLVEEEGLHSYLAVPLVKGGVTIGVITLSRQEVRPFAPDEIALVETFAAQAVIALENVRQFRELQTRLEREAATRKILDVISRSRDDATPVFEIINETAKRLCRASNGAIVLGRKGGGPQVLATQTGASETTLKRYRDGFYTMDPDVSIAARSIIAGETLYYPKVAEGEPYREGMEAARMLVEVEGVKTSLYVPLMLDGQAIGCLNLHHMDQRTYTDDEIALVESFAAQAVIAIENVRQFREVQERLAREEATGRVLGVISTSRDDEAPVFDAILAQASSLCDAPFAFLCLTDPRNNVIRVAGTHGVSAAFVDGAKDFAAPMDSPLLVGVSIREKRVINVRDLREEHRDRPVDHPGRLGSIEEEGIRSVLYVPLVSDGVGRGCIAVFRRTVQAFSSDEVKLIETFAAQAMIAIENVRQFRDVQTRLEREAASAEILKVISKSRDDDKPVFDVILENAARLCNAPHAFLQLRSEDDSHLAVAAQNFAASAFLDGLRANPIPIHNNPGSISVLGMNADEPTMYDDVGALKGTDLYTEQLGNAIDREGMRTALFVPLKADDRSIGVIVLYRLEVAPFSEDEIALVQTFAAQAVIAVESVRQFRELQTRLEREAATKDVLHVISQTRDDERPVFDLIVERAAKLCNASVSGLLLGKVGDERLELVANSGMPKSLVAMYRPDRFLVKPAETFAGRTIASKRPLHITDPTSTNEYQHGEEFFRATVDEIGFKSCLFVPLVDESEGIGCIMLPRTEARAFTDDEIALVETFAAQAVIAIRNARQYRDLETLNAELGDRVEEQVGEIERMGRLKRFLPAQVADAVVSKGDDMLSSHRALIATLFCDIRGFTAFCERAEPEETIEVLQTYHEEMGKLLDEYGAGVDHRSGDGIMAIFNDPLPCDDPAGDALRLALAMRARMEELCKGWKRLGHRLGFGVGISFGYATVGMVGSEGRYEYTASGTSVNLASRLCDEAENGEILLSPRAVAALEDDFELAPHGEVTLKGIQDPVQVHRVVSGGD